jgi:hypothetical protein
MAQFTVTILDGMFSNYAAFTLSTVIIYWT